MSVEPITDNDLKQGEITGPAIIKFYADWCGSCKLISPKFKRLSEDEQYQGIRFLETNAEKNPVVRKWAGVTNLPFFATVKDGKVLEASMAGKEEKIVDMLSKLKQS
jgi:thiol-disulfide isomerase/thioredoxin